MQVALRRGYRRRDGDNVAALQRIQTAKGEVSPTFRDQVAEKSSLAKESRLPGKARAGATGSRRTRSGRDQLGLFGVIGCRARVSCGVGEGGFGTWPGIDSMAR